MRFRVENDHGEKIIIETKNLTDTEYLAYFPQIWEGCCLEIAKAAGRDLEEIRRKRARKKKKTGRK